MKCQSVVTQAHFSLALSSLQVHPGTNNSSLHQASPLSIPPVPPSDLMHSACLAPFMQLHSSVCTCRHIFLWEEPEPHTPNTYTAFSHSKWPLLWQQQLNSKFREAFSTNYERRDETLGRAMPGLMPHSGSIHQLLWDTLGTLPLVVCHLLPSTVQETAFSSPGFVFILLCADSKWPFSHLTGHRTVCSPPSLVLNASAGIIHGLVAWGGNFLLMKGRKDTGPI